jgi:hypothetical protein
MSLTLLAAKAVQHGILPFCRCAQPILRLNTCLEPRHSWLCAGYAGVLFGIANSVANPPINGAFLHLAVVAFAVTLRGLQAPAVYRQGALPLPEWGFAVDSEHSVDQSLS